MGLAQVVNALLSSRHWNVAVSSTVKVNVAVVASVADWFAGPDVSATTGTVVSVAGAVTVHVRVSGVDALPALSTACTVKVWLATVSAE